MTPSQDQSVPYGLCHCGCGQKTNPHTVTITRIGQFKGKPQRFIFGHYRKIHSGPEYKAEDRGYETPCWTWLWSKDRYGYGELWTKLERSAHRNYYRQKFGDIPEKMVIDHLCRNRDCVNPDHMELVTSVENVRRGKSTKLSREKAAQIREAAKHTSQADLVRIYGVSPALICGVIKGTKWPLRHQ